MEVMKMVVLCASNTQGTRTIDCHDANQTLILQIVAFRQPREYESVMDMLKPHTQPQFNPLSTLPVFASVSKTDSKKSLSHFKLLQTITIRLKTTQDEGLTKSNASLCFQHL
jgi:hypothetical protein